MKAEDVEYIQKKLGEMNEGKRHNWNLRDRALVSQLLIYWLQSASANPLGSRTYTSSNNIASVHFTSGLEQ